MAPRSAKTKKTAEVKMAENEGPKKGRGKTKIVEEPELELTEPEIKEKVAPASDKKTKRGKKVTSETNGQEEANGAVEDVAPPAKKGRKKNNEEVEEKLEIHEESPVPEEIEQNGDAEPELQQSSTAKGRKKQGKKESVQEKPKESGKGKKNAKQGKPETEVAQIEESNEDKPKSTGKGRGRKAQPKTDKETEQEEEIEEEVKPDPPASKGKKKGGKPLKEKASDNDKGDAADLDEKVEDVKKGKKNQGKKNITKEETETEEGKDDVQIIKKRKPAKKEKGKGDAKDDEAIEGESPEPKAGKGKRGQKKPIENVEVEEDPLEPEEPSSKRRRKPAEEKATAADSKKKAPLKNKAATDYESIDFSNNSKNFKGIDWNFKISSWNVDGIRAWLNKGGLDYLKYEKPDILCLQEIKCSQDKFPEEVTNLQGYHPYWLSGDKDGYAGVGIYTTKLAMNVQYGLQNKELDSEGRIITAEYEQFYLICTYVPNAGRKLVTLPKRLQWNEEFRKYVKELDKKKPVIICGDMNVAHNEIDLANPKTNRKNAGFTDEERAGMTELLGDGFVDTYRHLYPDNKGAYTFWTYMMNSRSKNVGWRLDYFIVSERLLSSVCDNVIRDQVYGSDHCPITLFLHLTSAVKPKE